MKHLKRLISGLLLAALLLCCLVGIPTLHLEASAATVASGSCGSGVRWSLDDSGKLTISGSGKITDYSKSNPAPWYNYYNSVRSVIITSGVTRIGDYAFFGCSRMTSITIPNSVTSIGNTAFSNCGVLPAVTIPNSVTSIGNFAFEWTNLSSITIPASVASIGTGAFTTCRYLTSIQVEKGNATYHSAGNCIIETDSKTLIAGCKTSQVPTDGSITIIDDYAFRGCTNLTKVVIPDGVTSIGDRAFSDCYDLTSVTIPDTLTSIGNSAFERCNKLTNFTIPGKVSYIGDYAFRSCFGLTSITLPDSVTNIGIYAFADCTGLSSVSIGNNINSISDYAFYACNKLTSITIPDNVVNVGNYAFQSCSALTSVKLGRKVTSIGDYAFYKCSGLTSITIPDSISSIGDFAFRDCTNLKDVFFEGSAPEMESRIFYNVTATAYYYPNNTWTKEVMQNYGGTITWAPMGVSISYTAHGEITDPITIEIFPESSQESAYSYTNETSPTNTGIWTVKGAADGIYTVNVIKKNHVAREYTLIVVDNCAFLEVEIYLLGDIDGDGRVNYMDYGQVLSQAKGNGVLQGYALLCGDVTSDGRINYLDYGKILSQAKGKCTLWQ